MTRRWLYWHVASGAIVFTYTDGSKRALDLRTGKEAS
jgi:hypothetical protein